jgi:general secretion pathway protein E
VTEALAEKITSNAPVAELKAQALKDGMVPMRHYGWVKAANGITTVEEVVRVTAGGGE